MPGSSNYKVVYLTFDDGPHPIATPFVLDVLKKYNVKASFFCIGKNIKQYPDIFKRILDEGHSVGNHTQNHLNGLKCNKKAYLDDYNRCQQLYPFKMFRPPYGKMLISQYKALSKETKIIMWDVLTRDYDKNIDKEYCINAVKRNCKNGSIIVFHDSEKAFANMSASLEECILFLKKQQFSFNLISNV